jgi:hypothetical protein
MLWLFKLGSIGSWFQVLAVAGLTLVFDTRFAPGWWLLGLIALCIWTRAAIVLWRGAVVSHEDGTGWNILSVLAVAIVLAGNLASLIRAIVNGLPKANEALIVVVWGCIPIVIITACVFALVQGLRRPTPVIGN